ncbi:MAG: hypothetical protein M0R21_03235, partial [Lentimicrobiaceae bacterium]|nr:hypothetical protein [Lentimicrobiaceae bacterium]
MKKLELIFILLLVLPMVIQAQYTGGYGKGDVSFVIYSSNPINWFTGGNGRGDVSLVYSAKALQLTLLLEGLMNNVRSMNKAQDETGDHFTGNTADQIMVELHESTSPYLVTHSANNVNLNTDGSVAIIIPETCSGNYYVSIKHHNSIGTWSAIPVSFSSRTTNYNFTDNASKSYGNNLKNVSGAFVIYGGDVNQDGFVDSGDMTP